MTDIANRLRRWAISTNAVPASDLMDEAAAEIDRLRLTDAERLAIQWVIGDALSVDGVSIQETLRGLLERLK